MLELEWKERQLKGKCKKFSKRISKFKDVVPLTEDIAVWGIGIDELLALKVGINQAAKHYNLPPLAATLRLIDDIKKYNKINGAKSMISLGLILLHITEFFQFPVSQVNIKMIVERICLWSKSIPSLNDLYFFILFNVLRII